jgi:hypothetical protein
MGAIDNFLKRWGFAKLDRYGLILTPDDRVISMRPAVLDDGLGGKIVGWLEGDLAAMELDRWGATKPATAKPVTAPASLHKLPPTARVVAPAVPASPAPNTAPAAAKTSRPLPGVAPVAAPIPPRATAAAPVVAVNAEPGEDEWEWEIAMARARAAAEEVEEARVDLLGASAVIASAVIQRKTQIGISAIKPMPHAVKHPEPEPLPPWPGTEPFNESWGDKSEIQPQVMSVMEKKLAVARTPARGSAAVPAPRSLPLPSSTLPSVASALPLPPSTLPSIAANLPLPPSTLPSLGTTVIPVPQLPAAADPRLVRPAPYTPTQPRGRVARGTGSPPRRIEETVRTAAVPPANDDRTSPYIELPTEVKPSGFAHTKRVAAKQR